jgi:hypothetical protein
MQPDESYVFQTVNVWVYFGVIQQVGNSRTYLIKGGDHNRQRSNARGILAVDCWPKWRIAVQQGESPCLCDSRLSIQKIVLYGLDDLPSRPPASTVTAQDFVPLVPLDFNDKLRLASSWFGMCGIAAQLSPVPGSSGASLNIITQPTFDPTLKQHGCMSAFLHFHTREHS